MAKTQYVPEPVEDCDGSHMTVEVGVEVPHCRKCGGRQSPKTGKVMKDKVHPLRRLQAQHDVRSMSDQTDMTRSDLECAAEEVARLRAFLAAIAHVRSQREADPLLDADLMEEISDCEVRRLLFGSEEDPE